MESLKENSNVSEYVTSMVIDKTVEVEKKTIEGILYVLKDEYSKTKVEKI